MVTEGGRRLKKMPTVFKRNFQLNLKESDPIKGKTHDSM